VQTIGMVRACVKIGMANLAYNFTQLAWLKGQAAPAGPRSLGKTPATDPSEINQTVPARQMPLLGTASTSSAAEPGFRAVLSARRSR
jgi:hypothetical protein